MNRHLPAIALVMLTFALSGCGEPRVSSSQAQEAFVVAYGAASVGAIAASLGRELPGTTVLESGKRVEFTSFDVRDLATDYQDVSGSLVTNESSVHAEFTLAGGAVRSLSFDLPLDRLASEGTVSATVKANGRDYAVAVQAPSE